MKDVVLDVDWLLYIPAGNDNHLGVGDCVTAGWLS